LTEYTRSISFYFGEKAPGINVELIQKYVANDLQSIGNNFTQAMRSKSWHREAAAREAAASFAGFKLRVKRLKYCTCTFWNNKKKSNVLLP
jgi:hypothetical protein